MTSSGRNLSRFRNETKPKAQPKRLSFRPWVVLSSIIFGSCVISSTKWQRIRGFGVCTPISGRWQAPAAVLPPEGWQRGRGPEDKGHGHSRAREWPKHASPRARRARGRAKLSARFGACQCYYMFFTIQPKIAILMAQFKYLKNGQNA